MTIGITHSLGPSRSQKNLIASEPGADGKADRHGLIGRIQVDL